MSQDEAFKRTIVAASCPGGIARQFRVQVASGETSSSWKLVGSFRDGHKAGECAARHEQAGQTTRVVACNSLPTAA
jgi:hypothetical protein